jgi:hypothetical protein
MNQKIRIKLRSYDHNLVDKSTEKIVKTVRNSGAVVTGPIPLPTEKKIFTVLRSPHVNKNLVSSSSCAPTSASLKFTRPPRRQSMPCPNWNCQVGWTFK